MAELAGKSILNAGTASGMGLFASTPEAEEYLVTPTPMGRLAERHEIAKAGLSVDGAYVAT